MQSVFGGRHGGIDGVGKMKALAKHAPLQIVMILFMILKDERVKMRQQVPCEIDTAFIRNQTLI